MYENQNWNNTTNIFFLAQLAAWDSSKIGAPRSLRVAYSEEAQTLTLKHLKIGALGAERLRQIKEEAEKGLRRFREESSFFEQPAMRKHRAQSSAINYVPPHGRVGQRKPKRDAVGVNPDGL